MSSEKWRPFCLGPNMITQHVIQAAIDGIIILVSYIQVTATYLSRIIPVTS